MFRIKPEYLSMWGDETTEDTLIDMSEVKRLSEEWEVPIEDLLDQLIPEENEEDDQL